MLGRTVFLFWMIIASLGLFGTAKLSANEDLPDVRCTKGEQAGSIINSKSCAVVFRFSGADRMFFHLSRRTLAYLGNSVRKNSKAAIELRNIAESFRIFSRSDELRETPERSLAFIYTKPISSNRRQVCAIFFLTSWDTSLSEAKQHRLGSDCYDIIVRLAWAAAATVSAEDELRTSMFINNVFSNRQLAAKLTREDSVLAFMGRMAGRLKPTTQGSLVVVLRPAPRSDEGMFGGGLVSVVRDIEVANPKFVTRIKTKMLIVYKSENGRVRERLPRDQFELPFVIVRSAPNGRLLVVHPKTGEEFWIPKMIVLTDEESPGVTVACDRATTKSYVASQGFGDCD